VSKLPDYVYPKLRRRLAELRKEISKDPEKIREYERFRQLTQDITNSRLRKIVSIASAPAQTENTLRNFTTEEKLLYDRLYRLINNWRKQILEYEGGAE
jgi:DNA replication initiation complex subunit (GINS family)